MLVRPRREPRRARPILVVLEERSLLSTYTVMNTNDSGPGSLRCEIDLAISNGGANTIDFDSTFDNTAETISLTSGQLELSGTGGTEVIVGPAGGVTVSVSGSNGSVLSRVFQVDAGVTASISGLTISGGDASGSGGGLYNDGGTVALSNCTVSGNLAAGSGGGLATGENGTTTLLNCTVSDNLASGNGGGLYDYEGTTTLSGCTVSGNIASEKGGGLYDFVGDMTLSDVTLTNNQAIDGAGLAVFYDTATLSECTLTEDIASASGGGLYSDGGTISLTQCSLSGDTASLDGGALYNTYGTTLLYYSTVNENLASVSGGGVFTGKYGTTTLSNCTVSGNSGINGGGLYNFYGTTNLTNVVVSGNSAVNGGGMSNYFGSTTLSNCTVSGNMAAGDGGGMLNSSGTTTLSACSISGNYAAADGGGLGNASNGTTTAYYCSLSGNTTLGLGGGINTNNSTTVLYGCAVSGNTAGNSTNSGSGGGLSTENSGEASLTNCTISGNSATGTGGGVYATTSGKTTLTGVTISANSAGAFGGGVGNGTGIVTLGNTIVAANAAADGAPDAIGIVASLGHNLVGVTDGSSGWISSDLTGTSSLPLNPLLAPLGNYGGPTQTMPLLPGSPALDAGSNALIPAGITTDQRGFQRIVNGVVDIGAFESGQFTISVTSGSGQSTPISTAFPAPLIATVYANNAIEPVAGGLVGFTAPASGATATLVGSPATISLNGEVSVTATANGVVGGYIVSAGALGISNTANFSLINQAIPVITTMPNMTAVTLQNAPVTLEDTASLTNGYYETGTLTFTLYQGSTLVDTETVSVDGNGTYTTPTGYTLPSTGAVTGTYQWDASYAATAYNIRPARQQQRRAGSGQHREPDDHDNPERDHGDAGHVVGDAEGHGGTVGRLLRDRHNHVHAVSGQHAGGHRDGPSQWQRHLHDADRLHAADDGHGDWHLPVGRQLQRRHEQQPGKREQQPRPNR